MRRFATAYLTRTAELYSRFRETVSRRRLSGEPELGRGDWDQQPAPDLDRVQPAGGDLLEGLGSTEAGPVQKFREAEATLLGAGDCLTNSRTLRRSVGQPASGALRKHLELLPRYCWNLTTVTLGRHS